MIFQQAIPILYSMDVLKSLKYYVEVLGFDKGWDWGDPPTFGGVIKDSVEIFFCKEYQGNPGTWLALIVDDVDEFYESVKAKGAKILMAPKTQEWGMREMLVEDPDGHVIRFGHAAHHDGGRNKSSDLPQSVRIVARAPSNEEYRQLASTMNGNETIVPAAVHTVVAEDATTGNLIGCVSLLGDNAGFYYIRNLMVHPEWQGKHIGTALMKALNTWLEKNVSDYAYVGLHTAEHLAPFYRQVGFAPAFGMYREIRKK